MQRAVAGARVHERVGEQLERQQLRNVEVGKGELAAPEGAVVEAEAVVDEVQRQGAGRGGQLASTCAANQCTCSFFSGGRAGASLRLPSVRTMRSAPK